MSVEPPPSRRELVLRGERLRRNLFAPAAGAVLTIGGAVALARGNPLGLPGVLVGLILAVGSWRRNSWPRSRPTTVRVGAQGLVLDDDAPLAAEEIAEARSVMGEQRLPEVQLVLRDGSVRWLRLTTGDDQRLMAALGVEAGGRRASFPLQSRFRTRWAASLVVMLGLAACWSRHGVVGEVLTLFFWLAMTLGPLLAALLDTVVRGRVVIGADGYVTRWWPRFTRYVAFREVAEVAAEDSLLGGRVGALVRRRDGRTQVLVARNDPTTAAQQGVEPEALRHHLTQAFERSRAQDDRAQTVEALLPPAQPGASAWLASFDAIERGGGMRYRVAAPTVDQLDEVLRDAALAPEARAAAAAMMVRRGEPAGRQRVRVAADACAQPALREALLGLEQAQDDEAFVTALEAVRASASR